jgi:hypothetical protein
MRLRLGFLAILLVFAALAFARPNSPASANLQDAATPEAAASPAALPVEVVTLVGWYSPDPSGEFLNIGPIRTNDLLVAGPAEPNDRSLVGTVDFDDPNNKDLPRFEFGETLFNATLPIADDPSSVFAWIYIDGDPALRPATLVIEIKAVRGPYDNYTGTATFVSRAAEAGGVLIIVLNPPE